jgi:hypothetical protein
MVPGGFAWARGRRGAIAGGCVVGAVAALVAGCGARSPLDGTLIEIVYVDDAGPAHVIDAAIGVDSGNGGSGFDAADTGSGEPDDAAMLADVALPPADLGNVLLTSGSYEDGTIQPLIAQAVFYPSVAATGCSIAPLDGCTLETCVAGAGSTAPLVGAGSITITGGAYPLVLTEPTPDSVYGPAMDGGLLALWNGGEGLVVTASGDVVPAFAGSLIAPTQVTVTTPMPSSIVRSSPLALSWSGASAGKLTVDLSAGTGTNDYYLECQFDVSAGTGTIPAAALAVLPAGSAGMTVSTLDRVDVEDGAWTVQIFAQTNASDTSGAEYEGTGGVK